jgi:hypothetical protein
LKRRKNSQKFEGNREERERRVRRVRKRGKKTGEREGKT